jgi:hypothetical protein
MVEKLFSPQASCAAVEVTEKKGRVWMVSSRILISSQILVDIAQFSCKILI